MGLFTAIGGVLGLINSNDTASKLAGDMSNGLDMLIHTSEEKAIEKAAAVGQWLRMLEMMKGSEQYRSVTRRILAVGIVFNLLCMIWICIWAEFSATFGWFGLTASYEDGVAIFTPLTMAIIKIATVFQLGWVFCTIIVFYFGPHLLQFIGKKK